MTIDLRWRLSLMMLLQYAIWGAWAPVLSGYLSDPVSKGGLGFNGNQTGFIYSLLPLALIVTPFIAGQYADRRFASQKLLGVLHLLCAASLYVMAGQHAYHGMVAWMLIYCLLYAPTLALTNSLSFHHLAKAEPGSANADEKFGSIRVFGTIGWILAGWVLTFLRTSMPHLTPAGSSDTLVLAAVFSVALGLFCFALPNTPPKTEGTDPRAYLKALRLLKDRNFAVFMAISFVVATELQFYYVLTAPFLEHGMHVPAAQVPRVMTISQMAEFVVMAFLLPVLLPRLGVRRTMVFGILAWPIRYVIFAAGATILALKPLVIAALTLHGFCYVFFFVVGFIYVDQVSTDDIRASAQSLVALVVLGAGAAVGSWFSGWIDTTFTNAATHVTNWTEVFLIPCALTVVCAILFPMLFRDTKRVDAGAAAKEALPVD